MPESSSIPPHHREASKSISPDRRIAELARCQHGVVSRAQLLGLGLSSSAIGRRISIGRLHRRHAGVYAVGHAALNPLASRMAALLACGDHAAVSHRSAAALLDLRQDSRTTTDVTSPTGAGRNRAGICAHWGVLAPSETTIATGIRCTSVERTLVDLAGVLDRRSLERAVERAEILRILDWCELERITERAGPRRGIATIRSIIASTTFIPGLTRSEFEHRFVALCELARLPSPRVNEAIELPEGRLEVDFLWPRASVIAETDGRAIHATRTAFDRDRRRDQRLAVAGYRSSASPGGRSCTTP